MSVQDDVTELLRELAEGNQGALDDLLPLVYEQLRAMAHHHLIKERRDHTLNTTALVHEAYLKLVKLDRLQYQNRDHFFAIAAQAMRRILVDYAVRRTAQKRGGKRNKVPLDEVELLSAERAEEVLALHDALERLEAIDARQGRVVECRFFAALGVEETARALDISPATVKRDWTAARAWLNRELSVK